MDYRILKYESLSAQVQLSSYKADKAAGEYHIIVTVDNPRLAYDEQVSNLLVAYKQALGCISANAKAVMKRYFLSDATNQAYRLPKDDQCAVSVVEQPPLYGTKIALWAQLIDCAAVERLPNGFARVERGGYEHLWKAGMNAPDLSSEVATIAMLADYSTALNHMGCTLADNCMRTWFFVHDVDINYSGMVNGRNQVFRCSGLTLDTHFIASTGIGGKHPNPKAVVMLDAYAVKGVKPEQVKYLHAPENLNPTYEYGVAFERGTSVDYGDRRHVFISGTASINNKGEVMHNGNIVGQTHRMLANIEALLKDADAEWGDVTHGIVYLRDLADYAVVAEILKDKLPELPIVIVLAPVCRHGWLVEMECSAIKSISSDFPFF